MIYKGKTFFITGASRGIGLAIAKRVAKQGANIAIIAKTAKPHPKLEGTIYTAAEEIEQEGGNALPIMVDIRDEEHVQQAVEKTVHTFGGIDVCVNNASAIFLSNTLQTPMKRYDLMQNVNTRGSFLVSQTCLPYLLKAENPHILMLSPPLDLKGCWFSNHLAYSIAKFGMSLCVLGLAEEYKGNIAVNALWPRTAIATHAVKNILANEATFQNCRKAEILADAAHLIFQKQAREFSGNFLIDDSFIYQETGKTDFSHYSVNPEKRLIPDFFVPETPSPPPGVTFEGNQKD